MTTPTTPLDPIEVTTRYATTVDTLPDAWAFVMAYLDRVGPDPRITINPIHIISVQEMYDDGPNDDWARRFEVVVSGMVEEDA